MDRGITRTELVIKLGVPALAACNNVISAVDKPYHLRWVESQATCHVNTILQVLCIESCTNQTPEAFLQERRTDADPNVGEINQDHFTVVQQGPFEDFLPKAGTAVLPIGWIAAKRQWRELFCNIYRDTHHLKDRNAITLRLFL